MVYPVLKSKGIFTIDDKRRTKSSGLQTTNKIIAGETTSGSASSYASSGDDEKSSKDTEVKKGSKYWVSEDPEESHHHDVDDVKIECLLSFDDDKITIGNSCYPESSCGAFKTSSDGLEKKSNNQKYAAAATHGSQLKENPHMKYGDDQKKNDSNHEIREDRMFMSQGSEERRKGLFERKVIPSLGSLVPCGKREEVQADQKEKMDYENEELKPEEILQKMRHHLNHQLEDYDTSSHLFSIPFSSGTTGEPKAVRKSQKSMLCLKNLHQDKFGFGTLHETEVISCHSPFTHVGGMAMLIQSLVSSNTTALIIPGFDPKTFLCNTFRYGITSAFLVPSYLKMINRFITYHQGHHDYDVSRFSSLSDVIIAGEILDETTAHDFLKNFPSLQRFRQSYGSTEMGWATLTPLNYSIDKKNMTSSGILLNDFKIRIMDRNTGQSLGPDLLGEIQVKGPQVTPGYLNNSKANDESFTPDGFFKSGDGGYLDSSGFLYVSDRFKEIIKFDGIQVSPYELESILMQHPLIKETSVIGLSHLVHGEVPLAFVVLHDPTVSHVYTTATDVCLVNKSTGQLEKRTSCCVASPSDLMFWEDELISKELDDLISGQVAPFKRMRGGFKFLHPSFPRTIIGKVDKKFLKSIQIRSLSDVLC